MSLRLRIVLAVVLVLATGSGIGLALAGWHARQWLRAELTSAQLSGRLESERAFAELTHADQPEHDLAALIASFDGDRHLRALLEDRGGRVLAASQPAPTAVPPPWFGALLGRQIGPVWLYPPGTPGRVVELEPVYADDVDAVWAEFLDLAMVLTLASAGGGLLVFAVLGEALKPLGAIGQALPRIGAGDYAARVPERGAPELAALGRGVNEMAARLAAMQGRNRALEEQILTLQDEERADIARDLHDEIGPHLFAANVDAAMAADLIADGRAEEALEQVRRLAAAIAHTQRLVRDILGRLRPPQLAELGLARAIGDLAAFWSARRPGLAFETRLASDLDELSEVVQETIYRIVQESLSNAVRHGAPTRVEIVVERLAGWARLEVVNDGAAGASQAPGYGLTGMAERLAAVGGTLDAGRSGADEWRVAAELPVVSEPLHEAA